MKKIALTIAAVAGASLTGFSQGQVGFDNGAANGYVVESSASHTAASASSYNISQNFTAQLWALSGPTTTVPGAVDAYGYIDPNSLGSAGFTLCSESLGVTGTGGAFSEALNVHVPGTVNANTVLAVLCWSGTWADLATAEANNAYIGAIAFVNPVGPSGNTPYSGKIDAGWNTLVNSPLCAAVSSTTQDLIMTQLAPVPEPGTMALAALGGASMLLFRRRK